MNHEARAEEIMDLIRQGKDELIKAVLIEYWMMSYATGLKDGKEIGGWKK